MHWRGKCALESTLPIRASSWLWKCQHLASHQSPKQELSRKPVPRTSEQSLLRAKITWDFTAVRRAQCRYSWSKHKCLLCKWEEKQPNHLQESRSKPGSFNSQQQRLYHTLARHCETLNLLVLWERELTAWQLHGKMKQSWLMAGSVLTMMQPVCRLNVW